MTFFNYREGCGQAWRHKLHYCPKVKTYINASLLPFDGMVWRIDRWGI